jgi:hypothetical protein
VAEEFTEDELLETQHKIFDINKAGQLDAYPTLMAMRALYFMVVWKRRYRVLRYIRTGIVSFLIGSVIGFLIFK